LYRVERSLLRERRDEANQVLEAKFKGRKERTTDEIIQNPEIKV